MERVTFKYSGSTGSHFASGASQNHNDKRQIKIKRKNTQFIKYTQARTSLRGDRRCSRPLRDNFLFWNNNVLEWLKCKNAHFTKFNTNMTRLSFKITSVNRMSESMLRLIYFIQCNLNFIKHCKPISIKPTNIKS